MNTLEKQITRKRKFATKQFQEGIEWLRASRNCHCTEEPCVGMVRNALNCRKKATKFRSIARGMGL